jgi:Ca2+-binding RTX toxin-like protein
MQGDGGSDTASYDGRVAAVDVSLDGAANDGEPGEADIVHATTENVTGGLGADVTTGSSAANVLTGGPGRDRLNGAAGADRLNTRDGVADTVTGGAGADSAQLDAGLDVAKTVETLLP